VTGGSPRVEPFGDAALLVTFGETPDPEFNRRARSVAEAIEALRVVDRRFGRAVPAHASVLIPFDPIELPPAEARSVATRLAGEVAASPVAARIARQVRPVIEIPVRYGGGDGPDLEALAELHGLTPMDVVELHAGAEYGVYFLGFAPGFGYLGPLPAELATPRLATPRQRVPAGSVGIAELQTAVYPFAMPGGWRLVGRTEAAMWDLRRDPPALLAPGDRVRFVPER